jgi:hypothetical protein
MLTFWIQSKYLLARWLCAHFHGEPYTPVCGFYRCRRCLRVFPFPKENNEAANQRHVHQGSHATPERG